MPPKKSSKHGKDNDSARGKTKQHNHDETQESQEPEIDIQEVLSEILTDCANRINEAVLQRQENLINLMLSVDPGSNTKGNSKK